MATQVVNKHKAPFDVYIGRGSKWGNPFRIGPMSRLQVINAYRDYLSRHPELVEAARTELKDKVLGCYCKPLDCHGDVLARVANGGEL